MLEFIFVLLMATLQWLSIWHGVAEINKKEKDKRKVAFYKPFCTIGIPASLGVLISFIILFTSVPNWVSIVIHFGLSILFAFIGNEVYQSLFVKEVKKTKTVQTKKTNQTKKNNQINKNTSKKKLKNRKKKK